MLGVVVVEVELWGFVVEVELGGFVVEVELGGFVVEVELGAFDELVVAAPVALMIPPDVLAVATPWP